MATGLEISLFGTCSVRLTGDVTAEIRGAKHRALFALLACAPMGRRSRSYLQETLWGQADYDSGNQNLRRALADLKKQLGDAYDSILTATMTDIELAMDRVRLLGGEGAFLHDLNVREPAFVDWRDSVRADPGQVAPLRRDTVAPTRIRPRISALPLSVPGGEADLGVLGDWVAEEICRTLSRSSLLTVISHLSGRSMAARMIDIAHVRETLDVDYVIAGTARRANGEVICDFDFVDVRSGELLWNRNVVCNEARVVQEMPDNLRDVLAAIGRTVAETSLRHVNGLRLPEIADHELLISGVSMMHRRRLKDFLMARQYLEEAVARVPNSPDTNAWLGKWYVLSVFKGYSTDRPGDTQKSLDYTARALDHDPDSSFALTIDGFAQGNILGNLGEAAQRYGAALDRNPNESLSWLLRGSLLAFQDKGEAAVRAAETARRLSPIDPFGYYYDSLTSTAHLAAGNFDKALEYADRSIQVNNRHISTLRAKITAQHALGDGQGARETGADLMRKFPDFKLSEYQRQHPSTQARLGEMVVEALRMAGIQ